MKRDRLSLKHIEAFRAVIATGSASKAAIELGLSQPAVSKIVGQAEALAGLKLFDRRLGRLIPTQQALRLYSETNVLFSTLEGLDGIVARVISQEVQPISLGSVPLLSMTLLPRVLPQWRSEAGRGLKLQTYDAPSLLSLLAAGRLELAITIATQPMPGCASAIVLRSPVYCAMPAGHRLASNKVILPKDLHNEAYIAISPNEGVRIDIDRALTMANASPDEVMQVPMMSAAVRMAEEGVGLTFVDVFGLHTADRARLVFRRFEPEVFFEFRAVWMRDHDPTFNRTGLIESLSGMARTMLKEAEDLVDAN